MTQPSRRDLLRLGLAAPLMSFARPTAPAAVASSLLDVDLEALVSRADLVYDTPVARSEEGLPIGNGRMGTLVWTSQDVVRMQINRVDVYPMNSATTSFFERNSDYCGGCGFVDVDFGAGGVFASPGVRQHLGVYEGLATIAGHGVTVRANAWHDRDVIAIEVDDQRPQPAPITIRLRMLRYVSQTSDQLERNVREHIVSVQTRNHTAASQLHVVSRPDGSRIALTQEFREGAHYNKSAVAIGVTGRAASAEIVNESEVRLTVSAGTGRFTILIASTASFAPDNDVVGTAVQHAEAAAAKGFVPLAAETRVWWHEFWSRGFIHMRSADGMADTIALNYAYFLYVMSSVSRGRYPAKFNGMLFNTAGDLRTWGSQHWFANLSCMYEAIPATNRWELVDPVFDMYSGMFDASARAAREQWGSEGIYIPETCWYDGLAALPGDIASEMRDLYLRRTPWEQRSARFMEYASTRHPHSSRWNWIQSGKWVDGRWEIADRGVGPYGPVNHSFATTGKIAYLYWRRYEFTLDREWLRVRAYPMLKGAVEFYRHYPNLLKGADGKYHIHDVNSNESVLGAQDTDEDLSAMRGTTAALIRASEILRIDAELRPAWQEFLTNLAPLPDTSLPDSLKPDTYVGPRVWTRGVKPALRGGGGLGPDWNSAPEWWFDLASVETGDRDRLAVANATLDAAFRGGAPSAATTVGVLSKVGIAAATLGRAEAVRHLIPNQIQVLQPERPTAYQGGARLANRMSLREGAQALDIESLGRAAEALQLALLQSHPPAPAEDPIIRVFPAWPSGWDASFTLLARGAFLVSSSMSRDVVQFVELESLEGAECRLRNPWGATPVILRRDGKPAETLSGSLVQFQTRRGEYVVISPRGVTPVPKHIG